MAITKQEINQNSDKVTFGDPKFHSNHESHKKVNKQTSPQRPE